MYPLPPNNPLQPGHLSHTDNPVCEGGGGVKNGHQSWIKLALKNHEQEHENRMVHKALTIII